MKKILTIIPAIFLLAAVSCEKEIPVPLEPDGDRLYLECFPACGHDTTYIRLAAALSVTGSGGSRELSGVGLYFRVGGRAYVPQLYSSDDFVYTYKVAAPLVAGDKVFLTASASGYPSVSSESSVPEAAEVDMQREIYDSSILRHRFIVRRNDGSGEKRHYGVVIRGRRSLEVVYADPEKAPETHVSYLDYPYKMSSPVKNGDGGIFADPTIMRVDVNGMNMVIFEDDGGNTPDLEVLVDIPYEEDGYVVSDPEYSVYRQTQYSVDIFSISALAYAYLMPSLNEMMISTGLVPPFIEESNVSGGYGITSCMGCTSSGWISAPEP